jgi:hypothetical protein
MNETYEEIMKIKCTQSHELQDIFTLTQDISVKYETTPEETGSEFRIFEGLERLILKEGICVRYEP